MSEVSDKTREQILAERKKKKEKKAALKNQSKGKIDLPLDKNDTLILKNSKTEKAEKTEPQKQLQHSVVEDIAEKNESDKSLRLEKNTVVVDNKKKSAFTKVKELEKISNENDAKEIKTELKNSLDITSAKTKAQLKAERRAKQEADRARKLEKNVSVQPKKDSKSIKKSEIVVPKSAATEITHKVKLFAHLYNLPLPDNTIKSEENIHPSIVQLEAQYLTRVISGADASCLALLNALKKVIMDYETPKNQEFSRGLESEISKCLNFLSKSKPIAVSMANAVKHLKYKINQTIGSNFKCKETICEWIDIYIKEQLEIAAAAIYLFVKDKISSGDVILTYGCCSLIQQILISAYKKGIKFRVIVADGRPWLEGREMLKKLVSAGISCTYVFVNGLSFIMPEVTKILLGAHALLANGYVMSQVGSSQIALLAKTYNVPVLVCCETHKFTERVQTDSFVYNELGNPDDLTSDKGCLSKELLKWKTIPYLTPLNLMYDVTPPDLVSAVVTEVAVLPCTSVPVILRIKPPELAY